MGVGAAAKDGYPCHSSINMNQAISKPGDRAAASISPDVRASFHASGVVLLHIGKGLVFSSNATGAFIVRGLLEGESMSRLVAGLSCKYGIDAGRIERDTAEFVAELRRHGFLATADGRSTCN